MNTDNTI